MMARMQARAAALIATILFGAPLLAFVLVIALVKGHASVAHYEAVSQIIPGAGACALVAAILLPSAGGSAPPD